MRGLLRLQMREDKHLGALRRLMPLTEEFRMRRVGALEAVGKTWEGMPCLVCRPSLHFLFLCTGETED